MWLFRSEMAHSTTCSVWTITFETPCWSCGRFSYPPVFLYYPHCFSSQLERAKGTGTNRKKKVPPRWQRPVLRYIILDSHLKKPKPVDLVKSTLPLLFWLWPLTDSWYCTKLRRDQTEKPRPIWMWSQFHPSFVEA